MGKHVVYLRTREEAELRARGQDPGGWVRALVRRELDERVLANSPLPPRPRVEKPPGIERRGI